MFGEKIVISDPLLYHCPLLLRQLKNNQNQTNKTGAHGKVKGKGVIFFTWPYPI
jgi:hypothetical protein